LVKGGSFNDNLQVQPGFPNRRDEGGGDFPRQKLKTCLPFCENLQYLLPNFLTPHSKFWQKSDFHALFAMFPAESRIKTFFINKISLEVDEGTVLYSVSAEFYHLPLFKTIGNPERERKLVALEIDLQQTEKYQLAFVITKYSLNMIFHF
jgi:hypothetical protein